MHIPLISLFPTVRGPNRLVHQEADSSVTGRAEYVRDEAAVIAWLLGDGAQDHEGFAESPSGFGQLLWELALSTSPLPSRAARRIGLLPGSTLGEAASVLLAAVEDPDGPRCRSFRSAAYYLGAGADRAPQPWRFMAT